MRRTIARLLLPLALLLPVAAVEGCKKPCPRDASAYVTAGC